MVFPVILRDPVVVENKELICWLSALAQISLIFFIHLTNPRWDIVNEILRLKPTFRGFGLNIYLTIIFVGIVDGLGAKRSLSK